MQTHASTNVSHLKHSTHFCPGCQPITTCGSVLTKRRWMLFNVVHSALQYLDPAIESDPRVVDNNDSAAAQGAPALASRSRREGSSRREELRTLARLRRCLWRELGPMQTLELAIEARLWQQAANLITLQPGAAAAARVHRPATSVHVRPTTTCLTPRHSFAPARRHRRPR